MCSRNSDYVENDVILMCL